MEPVSKLSDLCWQSLGMKFISGEENRNRMNRIYSWLINYCCIFVVLCAVLGCGSPSASSFEKGSVDAKQGVKDENLYKKDQGYRSGYDHAQTHIPKN